MRFDPNIVQAESVSQRESLVKNMIDGMRQNILAPGVYYADAFTRPLPAPVIGEDGKPMTMERRQQMAAERKLADLDWEKLNKGEVEGENPLHEAPIETEELGTSAQKLLPGLRIVRTSEYQEISKETLDALNEGTLDLPTSNMNLPAGNTK